MSDKRYPKRQKLLCWQATEYCSNNSLIGSSNPTSSASGSALFFTVAGTQYNHLISHNKITGERNNLKNLIVN